MLTLSVFMLLEKELDMGELLSAREKQGIRVEDEIQVILARHDGYRLLEETKKAETRKSADEETTTGDRLANSMHFDAAAERFFEDLVEDGCYISERREDGRRRLDIFGLLRRHDESLTGGDEAVLLHGGHHLGAHRRLRQRANSAHSGDGRRTHRMTELCSLQSFVT